MATERTPRAPNRIRELRQSRGLTLEQLAALVPHPKAGQSTDLSSIGKLERGGINLTKSWMDRVAAGLGVPPEDLISDRRFDPARRVPLIGKIAAGDWQSAMEDPIELIPCTVGGPNTFALQPEGDSMDRIVPAGGKIFVDPDDREMRDGKYYAMMRPDGDTTFKQFRTNPMRFEPCSTNPKHKPIPVGAEPLTTLGRVVGQQSDL